MTELSNEIVVPITGELVPLGDPARVADALDQVHDMKRRLDDVRRVLEDALRIESERQGSKTLHLNGYTAVISGGEKTVYEEIEELADELRELGMPEDRVSAIVVPKITHTVNQREASRAAKANPLYADAIEQHRRTVPDYYRVSIEKG